MVHGDIAGAFSLQYVDILWISCKALLFRYDFAHVHTLIVEYGSPILLIYSSASVCLPVRRI
jgi:hypothetical protein